MAKFVNAFSVAALLALATTFISNNSYAQYNTWFDFFVNQTFVNQVPGDQRRWRITYLPNGKMTAELVGGSTKFEGTWTVDEATGSFCGNWTGGNVGCHTLVKKDENTWLHMAGSTVATVYTIIERRTPPSKQAKKSEIKQTSLAQDTLDNNAIYYVANTRPPDAYLSLRTHPTSSSGQRIVTMPNGTKLQVLQRRDDKWWYVRVISSGQEGWVLSGQGNRTWIECCATEEAAQEKAQTTNNCVGFADDKVNRIICENSDAATLEKKLLQTRREILSKISTAEREVFYKNGFAFMNKRYACKSEGNDAKILSCILERTQAELTHLAVAFQKLLPEPIKTAAAIKTQIAAVSKRITEQADTVANADRRRDLDKLAARLSMGSDSMPEAELKVLEKDARAAVEILDEAAEFKQTAETANQQLAIVDAALKTLTFDAPLVQEIKATINLAKKAKADADLRSLKEALSKLALQPTQIRRLNEAKDHGFDTIEAYDQYEQDKRKLSRSGIRLKPR